MSMSNNISALILDVNKDTYANLHKNPDMSIGKRLKEARSEAGLSQKVLATKAGVSQSAISQLETGESGSATNIGSLAAALGVNALWLETGKGPKRAGDPDSNVEAGPDFRTNRMYPLISWVQAGAWTELCDNFQPGDADEWRPCHKDLGKCGYLLRAKGDSMTAPPGAEYSFPDGILLYVNAHVEPLPGKFVIVKRPRTQEATFKRLVMIDGELYLEALNPSWPNRYLKIEEGDQFCGVVMHAGFDMP